MKIENQEILNNGIPDQEILTQTREFSKKHTDNFVSLFETIKISSIEGNLKRLESKLESRTSNFG